MGLKRPAYEGGIAWHHVGEKSISLWRQGAFPGVAIEQIFGDDDSHEKWGISSWTAGVLCSALRDSRKRREELCRGTESLQPPLRLAKWRPCCWMGGVRDSGGQVINQVIDLLGR